MSDNAILSDMLMNRHPRRFRRSELVKSAAVGYRPTCSRALADDDDRNDFFSNRPNNLCEGFGEIGIGRPSRASLSGGPYAS
jgi:hypothetical protein